MSYSLVLPGMGESVSEATIVKWLKQPGDYVAVDDVVVEIATDKVDSDVPSPVAGILVEQRYHTDEIAQVGDVLAVIRQDGEEDDQVSTGSADISDRQDQPSADSDGTSLEQQEPIPGLEQLSAQAPVVVERYGQYGASERFYSPLVKTIAQKEGLSLSELDSIRGSGLEGRVTKQDVLDYIGGRGKAKAVESVQAPGTYSAETNGAMAGSLKEGERPIARSFSGNDEIIEMDRMRRLIAEHMVKSVQTSPHVCSFVEADVTNIVEWRNRVKASFEKREGEKITFTPIFIEAIARALKDFPMINISLEGTTIIKKKNINIGIAAALPNGNLIVPVIKNADQLNLIGLAKAVNNLANKARNNKLEPDDIKGGTFTLTNIGSFGNVMGTPIINQPEVAIMAVGTIAKKPAVIETPQGDLIGIRHMMFLSMSYDHRVVDGALGGMFIRKVADYLESWDVQREI